MNMTEESSEQHAAGSRQPRTEDSGLRTEDSVSRAPRRFGRFPVWIGGAAAVLAVVTLAAVVVMRGPISFQPREAGQALARIVIPEALAGDALTLVAETQDAAGAAVDTAFRVTSKVDVTADALKQNLRVVPPVPVEVTSVGAREFRVAPSEPLEPGIVYRLTAATVVQKDDGTQTRREFSWAVQTKNVFRALSSVPGDQSSGVPLDTGIEVTMSQTGWEDPNAVFTTDPKTDGRFETRGRSLAFVPAKPLAPGTIYTVTYKKGWKVAGSDRSLEKDYVIRFETAKAAAPETPTARIDPRSPFAETAPGKDAFIEVDAWQVSGMKLKIAVTGYALTKDDAASLMAKVESVPWWAYETKSRGEEYRAYATRKAFESEAAIETGANGYPTFLRIPAQKPGIYLIRVTPTATEAPAKSVDTWVVFQVTNAATYAMADASETLFWVMNLDTQRPIEGVPVAFGGANATTDADGLARLPTPADLASTSTDSAFVIATVGSGDLSALVPLGKESWVWRYSYGPWSRTTDTTAGYLYADRPLYRLTDSLSYFGVAQDRDTRRAPSGLTIQLRGGTIDYATYQQKIYAEQDLAPDEAGFFRGRIAWDTLAPGFYSLAVIRDGKTVSERQIEIRDVVKPAYTIDVTVAKAAIYAGDPIEGQVKAALFDGTPLSNHSIQVSLQGGGGTGDGTVTLVTDDAGAASFRFQTEKQTCVPENVWSCNSTWTQYVEAHPTDAEEAQIFGSASVSVWAARVSTDIEVKTTGNEADLTFTVRRVDASRSEGRDLQNVLGNPAPNIRLTGKIIERRWVRIDLGRNAYDYVEKRAVPQYRYEMRETARPEPVDLTTDAAGRAALRVSMADDVTYRVQVTAKDEIGAEDVRTAYFAKGWYTPWESESSFQNSVTLAPTVPRGDHPAYKLDENVSVSFIRNNAVMPDSATPSFLYVETMRGIRKTAVSTRATHAFRYREELVPNMTLYGVTFGPAGFVERSYTASFDTDQRKLTVTVTPDPSVTAPAGAVTAAIDVRGPDGNPVKDARVAFGAVDMSLLAASWTGDAEETPLNDLYAWVGDGILTTRQSHSALSEEMAPNAGAEFGGGGGESIRRDFKDTAVFDVVTTDAAGRATVSFKAPDNITSWRLTAVAATQDLSAGSGRAKLAVTKPVFVDAVVPQTLLDADAPVLKIRAFGAGLKSNETLIFRVDATTLGIANRYVTGTAGAPLYVSIDKLVPGDHAVVIRVEGSGGSDAIERRVRVATSRFMKDEFVSTELAPGVALPDIGALSEVAVRFESLTQSEYLPRVSGLSSAWSARAESKIAERVARLLLKNIYGQTGVEPSESLMRYQRPSGGISPLPYASEDAELSAKVAATDPDAFDRARLANYLWSVAEDKKASREEAVRALSGLAALGEPVLIQLRKTAEAPDLTWRERLAIGRGLESAGDREAARTILEKLLEQSEERDGLIRLTVSDDRKSVLESTAETAALAAGMGHPKAKGLDAYVQANWDDDALTDLDRAYYLAHVVPTLAAGDVTVKYAAGNGEQTVDLKDGYPKSVTLTAAEAKAFRVTGVSGPAAATFVRRTHGLPKTTPEIGLKREYLAPGAKTAEDFAEGMTVTVVLTPTWAANAQDGCYMVHDYLPSGLTPFISLFYDGMMPDGWYPDSVGTQDIGFVTCKGYGKSITYKARVVSRGTYKAEPAIMQSMVTPSVTALSGEQTVRIR